MQDAKNGNVFKKLLYNKEYENVRKNALDLFKFVADIAAATIIGKRVIVPLIATPLAKKVEKRMETKKQGAEPSNEDIKSQKQPENHTKFDVTSTGNSTNLLAKFNK